jgi:CRISPR-associated protein Cas1
MAWRVIAVSNPAHLSNHRGQLSIEQDEHVSVPIEDIDTLLVDSYGVTMSAQLLAKLSQNHTTVVFCDDKHLPASTLTPYEQHSRQQKISAAQLNAALPLKKRLWQRIVIQKVANQAEVLRRFGFKSEDVMDLGRAVKSGDSTNRESIAARLYFDRLLDDETRRRPLWYNAAFNYSYALVRSGLARQAAARGLVASQGIAHHSELNNFKLADDLLEPFRPIVDWYVMHDIAPGKAGERDASLTKLDRQQLIDILNKYVNIKNKRYTIKTAVGIQAESFSRAVMNADTETLRLPEIP